MTACATVADLLAITDNPGVAHVAGCRPQGAGRGIGTDRARVVRQIAIERKCKRRRCVREIKAHAA